MLLKCRKCGSVGGLNMPDTLINGGKIVPEHVKLYSLAFAAELLIVERSANFGSVATDLLNLAKHIEKEMNIYLAEK